MLYIGTLNSLVLFLINKNWLYALRSVCETDIFFNQSLGFFIKMFYIHQCFVVFSLSQEKKWNFFAISLLN